MFDVSLFFENQELFFVLILIVLGYLITLRLRIMFRIMGLGDIDILMMSLTFAGLFFITISFLSVPYSFLSSVTIPLVELEVFCALIMLIMLGILTRTYPNTLRDFCDKILNSKWELRIRNKTLNISVFRGIFILSIVSWFIPFINFEWGFSLFSIALSLFTIYGIFWAIEAIFDLSTLTKS